METKQNHDMVSDNERIELGQGVWYSPDTGFVMRDVTEYIPEQTGMIVGGEELQPKDEYHVSLINTRKYVDTPEHEQEIVAAVRQALDSVEIGGVTYSPDNRFLCQTGDEVTVIVRVQDTAGMTELKKRLAEQIEGYEQLSHVTLLKNKASRYGIAVPNVDFLAENAVPLVCFDAQQKVNDERAAYESE